jgi:dTDP-4-amino-4,6-dideoxygalactose transaminase
MKPLLRAKPYIPEDDIPSIVQHLEAVIRSGMFIQGKYVSELEKKFAAYCGTKYAVATNSGATALEVALRATGVVGKRVIVPTQTFVASVSAIVRSDNIPVIVDVEEDTQSLSERIIRENLTDDVFAVMWIHMAGFITPDYYNIKKLCDERGILLIEDASHAVGASIDGIKAGNLGFAGCFSLFATKIVTSGEGGIITTNDGDFAERCKIIRNHGSVRNVAPYDGIDFGVNCTYASSNYRMPELSAVVGVSQINRIDEFVAKRNDLAKAYDFYITNQKITKPKIPDNVVMTWWQYIVSLPVGTTLDQRTDICTRLLKNHGISTANAYWPPCHEQPAFIKYVNNQKYPIANDLLKRHLALPLYVEMDLEQVKFVADVVNEII